VCCASQQKQVADGRDGSSSTGQRGSDHVRKTPVKAGSTQLDVGTPIARGDILFHITNSGVDRSRVHDLTRQIEQLEDERPSITARLGNARMLLNDLTQQMRLFVEARILQLQARQDELRAELAAAQARSVEAKISLDRIATLGIPLETRYTSDVTASELCGG
jgi:hypothetical protein